MYAWTKVFNSVLELQNFFATETDRKGTMLEKVTHGGFYVEDEETLLIVRQTPDEGDQPKGRIRGCDRLRVYAFNCDCSKILFSQTIPTIADYRDETRQLGKKHDASDEAWVDAYLTENQCSGRSGEERELMLAAWHEGKRQALSLLPPPTCLRQRLHNAALAMCPTAAKQQGFTDMVARMLKDDNTSPIEIENAIIEGMFNGRAHGNWPMTDQQLVDMQRDLETASKKAKTRTANTKKAKLQQLAKNVKDAGVNLE